MGVKDVLRAGLTLGTVTFGGLTCGLGAAVAGVAGRTDLGDRCAILFSRALLKSAGVRAAVLGRENAAGLGRASSSQTIAATWTARCCCACCPCDSRS